MGEQESDQGAPESTDVGIAGQRAGARPTADKFIISKSQRPADYDPEYGNQFSMLLEKCFHCP